MENIIEKTEEDFKILGMTAPEDPHYVPFWAIATALLKSNTKTIPDSDARDICSKHQVLYEDLRRSSVFAYHLEGTVSFQSRAHETYARDKLEKGSRSVVQMVASWVA